MTHFADVDKNLMIIKSTEVSLPEIMVVNITSGGRARIRNHIQPVSDFHGGDGESEEIERAILQDLQQACNTSAALIEMRLEEL